MPDQIYLLAVLACSIMMGAMMLMMMVMMRGNHNHRGPADAGDEVARLRAEVDQLRAQNANTQRSADQAPNAS